VADGFWFIAIMPDARLAGRLHKELKMLQDPPPGVCVWPADDSDLSRLEARKNFHLFPFSFLAAFTLRCGMCARR
jgi:hypothetical protein